MRDSHECPIAGCPHRVPYEHLLCVAHWRQVPAALKNAVYRAWRHGSLSSHAQACENAIAAVEHREPREIGHV